MKKLKITFIMIALGLFASPLQAQDNVPGDDPSVFYSLRFFDSFMPDPFGWGEALKRKLNRKMRSFYYTLYSPGEENKIKVSLRKIFQSDLSKKAKKRKIREFYESLNKHKMSDSLKEAFRNTYKAI